MTPCAIFVLVTAMPGAAMHAPTQVAPVTHKPIARTVEAKRALGQEGVFTLSATTALSFEQGYGSYKPFTFVVQPEIGYFIIPHVLVGGTMRVLYKHALNTGQTTFGMGPFGAYHVHITDHWDFLPTVAFTFGFQKVSSEMGSSVVSNAGSFSLSAKFLWSVASPFQLVIAPYFSHTLYTREPQNGSYGIALGFQGWL